MIDYTCNGGKMTRGITVVTTLRDILAARGAPAAESTALAPHAIVLGWCIEILQGFFLVADDVMDHSETRRGQPCWYKLPTVGMDAVNDAIILESFFFSLLRAHFKNHAIASLAASYVPLFELFQDVSLQTQMGQMLDLLSQPQGAKGPELLPKFTLDRYKAVVRYKTAYYSFYLPLACGMVLAGLSDDASLEIAKEISVELGEKFQIEDDYLDCYADPQHLGKIGTDIKDHKCSWLIVQALLIVTPEQLDVIKTHYGKEDAASEARIKALFAELNMTALYDLQEEESHARIQALIEQRARPHGLPTVIFEQLLATIHRRSK